MEEFQEVTLESERLMLKRARYDLHYKVINKVVCDIQEHLEPWIVWAKTKPNPWGNSTYPYMSFSLFHFPFDIEYFIVVFLWTIHYFVVPIKPGINIFLCLSNLASRLKKPLGLKKLSTLSQCRKKWVSKEPSYNFCFSETNTKIYEPSLSPEWKAMRESQGKMVRLMCFAHQVCVTTEIKGEIKMVKKSSIAFCLAYIYLLRSHLPFNKFVKSLVIIFEFLLLCKLYLVAISVSVNEQKQPTEVFCKKRCY